MATTKHINTEPQRRRRNRVTVCRFCFNQVAPDFDDSLGCPNCPKKKTQRDN